ncbi:MAG TPA: glycosyl hydrolase family 18 protein, partial [Cytophagaceae bacterium]|nr:glycosyl hydrolase family 18 protein [Cytophagaceae bacterium]
MMKKQQFTDTVETWQKIMVLFTAHVQKTFVFVCMLTIGLMQSSFAQTNVVGYFPTYENFPNLINSIDLAKLTHLNIAFANPDGSGAIVVDGASNSAVTTVVNAAHAKNVKVLLSIGGAGAPGSNYHAAFSSSSSMTNFVNSCLNYATTYNLDGIDVDIEGDVLDGNQVTATQYQNFVTQLAAALHAKNKIMTSALANWFGDQVTNAAVAQFDFINLMAYDAAIPGTGDQPGPHASYQFAVDTYNYWHNKGVPGSKINIGVPFYGYGWGTYAGDPGGDSFASIVAKYPGAENSDQVGSGANAEYYNGIPTIKQKTAFAMQNGGGIMIWEISQDATGSKSLLTAINQVIVANSNPVPDNLAKGKSVTVSSTEVNTTVSTSASNATDGNYATRWSSAFADPQWITVDLGANYSVNRVKLSWEAAYATTYQIQISSDNSNWSTLKSVTGNATTTNDQTGLSGTGRYVRIYGTSRATVYGYSLYEIEVYGSAVESPYNGTAAAIPGTIEAENYDLGGEGLAYHDADAVNQGGAYRTDGVDVEACTDTGGGYDVGYIATGEWLKYTTNVTAAGNYDVSMRVAATAAGSMFHVTLDGTNITGTVNVPNTGGWQTWQTVTVKNVALTAGQKIMEIFMDAGPFNLNYVSFQP